MDYKAMTTPMASNLNLLRDTSEEMIDAMIYHQMICSLIYLTNARPDIYFAVNTLRHVHLMVAKHALRYVKGTVDYGLKYEANQNINLEGYEDSDWTGNSIDRKSTLGCYFSMRSNVISWCRKKQSYVALSTIEAKYVATCSDIWEVVCFF